ncbi:type II toxin-antitoxin system ParD family antitoxin [Nocardioides sp. LML1-1-1.1]|uniref:type II toxin-antitoxin system ParD family antitoxin n=1 Tax=Nocardioides sp. LML1-1-1.1 TaxID=3135248 RepID=UPI00341FA6CB
MSAAHHDPDLVAIEVPAEVAAALAARVDSGEYPSQGAVVMSGLRLLAEEDEVVHDSEVEQWLRTVAIPIARATAADPGRSLPADEVRGRLADRRARRG